ncbi:Cytochrome P450 144 [BD1-7 clade bacterium]|uniref:Cytochrome P450 144 n=1 Tax=BD1-7 clade bacterium TaxID=2029982 RepID=A0A5S9PRT0_9GAMM|nr:Cytochrome P450 144 [BD1-7 clade bacterium]
MHYRIYHARRLVVSFAYEYVLKVLSWLMALKPAFYIIVLFGLASITIGFCFVVEPITMAGLFDFGTLTPIALTDIRAYYGTMLIALGVALWVLSSNEHHAHAALIIIGAFCIGSASGRVIGMAIDTPVWSIHGLLFILEALTTLICFKAWQASNKQQPSEPLPVIHPTQPEDFQPLSQANFRQPYDYYRLLRDEYPLYKMPGQDFYLVSRYDDIVALARNTEALSNQLVEILATGRPKDPNKKGPSIIDHLGNMGIIPVDVFALQDPPVHTAERKIGHSGFNSRFIKSLEPEVEALSKSMMDEFLPRGNVEFVEAFAWKLPMRLIIGLLGFPEADYPKIKDWCVDGIQSLSGTATKAELIAIGSSAAQFMRYLWAGYLDIKRNPEQYPENCFTRQLAALADDPDSIMTDQRAVATIFQLLIAGSDSSASTMGSAVRILAENPDIEQRLRQHPEEIDAFIEEVFRTESAFQGHFRLTRQPITLHGQTLPPATRLFLMWASGNRDERYWEDPDAFIINRTNGKKHLTFGHGIHACLGRELARMEIRIVIRQLLERTQKLAIVGEAPYEASVFARTMVALPLAFERANTATPKTNGSVTETEQKLSADTSR